MRIFEIDDIDTVWAKSAGINLNIDPEYDEVMQILEILGRSRSPNRTRNFLPRIEQIENNLHTIIDAGLANDQSTKDLKLKAQSYLTKIQKLKAQL